MFSIWTATANRRHRIGSGYRRSASVLSFNHDGLEIARVRTRQRRWLPLWHIMVFVYLILLIRLIALADIGPAGYGNRMSEMRNGNILERSAARIMAMDPVSRRVAQGLHNVLKRLD